MSTALLAVLMLVLAPVFSAADNIRGRVVGRVTLSENIQPPPPMSLGLEDIIGIAIGEPRDLLTGLEISIEMPEEVYIYPGAYALYLYRSVVPAPSAEIASYGGERILFLPIERMRRLFIVVPLQGSGPSAAPSAGTVVLQNRPTAEQFPLALTILPVMKGIPGAAARAEFRLSVRPLFRNFGRAQVTVSGPDGLPLPGGFSLFINEREQPAAGAIVLEAGQHRFRVDAPGFASENVTVMIERGRTASVDIRLRRHISTLRIEVPAHAKIFIDGREIDTTRRIPRPIEPGERTVMVLMGEYQVTRRFMVEPGKNYSITVFFDISIKED